MKNVKNKIGSVKHTTLKDFFNVANLSAAQFIIENGDVNCILFYIITNFIELTASDKCFWIGMFKLLYETLECFSSGSLSKKFKLVEILFQPVGLLVFRSNANKNGCFSFLLGTY